MPDERIIEVEFLQDDLQEIRAHMTAGGQPEEVTPPRLLIDGLDQFQRDETLWKDLQDRQDSAAESIKQELKRRETLALLISMRSRTIRSEMEMHELGSQVQMLEASHADKRARGERLRQSIARIRHRIAMLEAKVENSTQLLPSEASSLRTRLIRLLSRRRG